MGLLSHFFKSLRTRVIYGMQGARPSPFHKNLYEQETTRAVVDCIASHAAKANALHVVVDADDRILEIERQSPYARLLNQQPNPLMSGYDLKYRLISQYQVNTTAMCYVQHEGGQPIMLLPVDYRQAEALPVEGGGYALRFEDGAGRQVLLPLAEVVMLRKYYHENEVFGGGNEPIYNTLNMVKASDEGLMEALSISNKVRGVIRAKKVMLSPDDIQKSTDEFRKRFKKAADNGGIVGVDATEDFYPLNITPWATNAAQMKDIRDNILRYFRTPEAILTSKYTSADFQAWYESVLEPIHIQMGLAFTNVCFTEQEYAAGHRLIFTSDLMTQMSMDSKTNLLVASKELGLFSRNEYRAMFGYSPIEGGDEYQISLNYVNSEDQALYQTGKEEEPHESEQTNQLND